MASFVHLVHGVDRRKVLVELNKQAAKHNRDYSCLLQMHIAKEETKFGLDEGELEIILSYLTNTQMSACWSYGNGDQYLRC